MKPKIIGIGEVLWDALPGGERIGGAPANFASHCGALGGKSYVISRVGAGERGERLIEHLASFGVSTVGISKDPEHRTGRVEVEIGEDGQPRFTIVRNVAWDHLEATLVLRMLVASTDAVCFGSLGQRSASARDAIRELVKAAPDRALKVFDVNLRGDFFSAELLDESLRLANVCKLSDVELPVIAGMFGIAGNVRDQLEALRERYDLRLVAYTRGCEGSVLLDAREWCEHPGFETTVR
ncbi:MAG: carbohydrate kinase, partial [Verrucomicrobiae bacterium]|nr:carbohydrate kinase [Verrucomicrobiae bacterium]